MTDEHQSSEDIDNNDDMSKIGLHNVDSNARIEQLERNLCYIQQQYETTLIDLRHEINRLEQENKELHYRLINTHSLSSSEQKSTNTDQLLSSTPEKFINENPFYFGQKIDELEKQLNKSEEKNIYLLQQINELNKKFLSKSDISLTNDNIKTPIQKLDNDYQDLLTITYEKQQEIAKLRSVLVEILNTERLNLQSKILIRNCLTSTDNNEISMSKTTTTPIDMLFTIDKQYRQRLNVSPTTNGKTLAFRHELPIRRLNISPPEIMKQRSISQQRPNLPSIIQGNNSPLLQNAMYLNDHPLNSINYSQHQCLIKIGETPIARRERRTQELQKNRLMKNLYH